MSSCLGLFFFFVCLLIDLPPLVLLLDGEQEGDDGEAAGGQHKVEPLRPDAGDGEQTQEHRADQVVPQQKF